MHNQDSSMHVNVLSGAHSVACHLVISWSGLCIKNCCVMKIDPQVELQIKELSCSGCMLYHCWDRSVLKCHRILLNVVNWKCSTFCWRACHHFPWTLPKPETGQYFTQYLHRHSPDGQRWLKQAPVWRLHVRWPHVQKENRVESELANRNNWHCCHWTGWW